MTHATTTDAFAAALLEPTRPVPPGVTTARGVPDAARFAVYRNNVFVTLVEALAKRFPVARRLVGEEFFRAMARAYAAEHRPSSPILAHYGDTFPGFIEAFPPAATVPYLADVVRLEVAWSEAYHAADAVPLPADRLSDWLPRVLAGPVPLHPSARLIRSPYPVGSIWSANAAETVGRVETWEPETILVVRPVSDVMVHRLPAEDAGFLAALFAGETLESAAAAALQTPGFDFGRAIVGLALLGSFIEPTDPENVP